jgi:predicted HicB family RNase H-like nuclease
VVSSFLHTSEAEPVEKTWPVKAKSRGESLNDFVTEAIENEIEMEAPA